MLLPLIIPIIIVTIIIIIFAIILFAPHKPSPPPPSNTWKCEDCKNNGGYNCINCILNENITQSTNNSIIERSISPNTNSILSSLNAFNLFEQNNKEQYNVGNTINDFNSSIIPVTVINCYPEYVNDGSKLSDFDTRNPIWTDSTPFGTKWASPKSQLPTGLYKGIIYNDNYPQGVVMGALNQGSCGSCWIYSSTSVVSDRYRIDNSRGISRVPNVGNLDKKIWYKVININQNNTTPELTNIAILNPNDSSYTEVLNCVSPFEVGACTIVQTGFDDPTANQICVTGNSNMVCNGGYPENVMQYFRTVGAHYTLSDIPTTSNPGVRVNGNIISYNPQNYVCDTCSSGKYNVCDYVAFQNTDNMNEIIKNYKKELYANGPFVVAFNVFQSFYDLFSNPNNRNVVYSVSQETLGNNIGGHAVAIVGWRTINERLAWIVRNSWGQSWGNNGFFLIDSATASLVSMYEYGKGIVSPLLSCPTDQPCKTQSLFSSKYTGTGYAQCNNCAIFS